MRKKSASYIDIGNTTHEIPDSKLIDDIASSANGLLDEIEYLYSDTRKDNKFAREIVFKGKRDGVTQWFKYLLTYDSEYEENYNTVPQYVGLTVSFPDSTLDKSPEKCIIGEKKEEGQYLLPLDKLTEEVLNKISLLQKKEKNN